MLSPTLLEILRNYWKAARPKEWLFPGIHDDRPITNNAVRAACQKAHRLSGLSKLVTTHSLYISLNPALICGPFNLNPGVDRTGQSGWKPALNHNEQFGRQGHGVM
jgi:hypothetical protein